MGTENRLSKSTPHELGVEYFGKYGSGEKGRSNRRKEILKEKLRDKLNSQPAVARSNDVGKKQKSKL